MYIKEITETIKEASQATNGISWIEFRHFQVFPPTQSAARASLNSYVRAPSYIVRRSVTFLCQTPKHLTTVYRQNNKMKSTASQTSSPSADLYDPDRNSIPDDDLSSVGSYTNTSEDESTTASMDTDGITSQTSSGRGSAVTKKHKVTKPPSNLFDPHEHGMESLHGRKMSDVQDACIQIAEDDVSITSSAYRRRVPLTTLATAEDNTSEDLLHRQTNDSKRTENTSGEKSKFGRPPHASSLKLAVSSTQDSNHHQSSNLTKTDTDVTSDTTTDSCRQRELITTVANDREVSLEALSQQSELQWSAVLPKRHRIAGSTSETGTPSKLKLPMDRSPREVNEQHNHIFTKTQVTIAGMPHPTVENNQKKAPLACASVQHLTKVLPALPSNPELTPMTFFTYRAQLTLDYLCPLTALMLLSTFAVGYSVAANPLIILL